MRAVPRLVIAGTGSGVGKTTVTVALTRALRARGLKVATFKCGPDYLDPTYHARATGVACHNLDGWMMGHDAVRATFTRAAGDADLALIEGVMGVFDGASPTGEAGSTAEIAKWLGAPVLLVIDASGMARTIAALARGVAAYDPDLNVAGVIAQRVGSRGHLDLLRKALLTPPILGGLPVEAALAFPSRHLGLVGFDRAALPDGILDAWGERAAAWFDLDAIVALARTAPAVEAPPAPSLDRAPPADAQARQAGAGPRSHRWAPPADAQARQLGAGPRSHRWAPPADAQARQLGAGPRSHLWAPRCRIAIAHDDAFHFYYEDNLRRLEAAGAELVRFSPIADAALPAVDGVYLGGGYPELHAEALAANHELKAALAAFRGPIYGECGGLMYLCDGLRTRDGRLHPMLGLLPGEAVMGDRLAALGYVEVETQARSLLGPAGSRFRGHQFRYSELRGVPDDVERLYRVRRRRDGDTTTEGYRRGNVLGTYVHAHWASNPELPAALIAACLEARR